MVLDHWSNDAMVSMDRYGLVHSVKRINEQKKIVEKNDNNHEGGHILNILTLSLQSHIKMFKEVQIACVNNSLFSNYSKTIRDLLFLHYPR